ncbi:phage portal protein [Aurantimonas coralicida]|uniref:phage portal protein n=1 Tax=Aurantimonas coralicida TaxID=182270 RepID=UPI0023A72DF1|nr:phage portal protein [Aurantimonas coralicida]MDE0921803.1 phage portal protein [Aurantimonas coralicida]
MLRTRARHFARTNAYASAGVSAYASNLVGYGITPAPKRGEGNTILTVQDVEGRRNFGAVCASVVASLVIDGEAFIRFHEIDGQLRLQILPAETVDEGLNSDRIHFGIEFNAFGRRVAFHLTNGERVAAEDMVHVFEGEVRGRSWFEPLIMRLGETDKLEDALVMGVQVAAMHAGFLVDQNGLGGLPYDGDQKGSILEGGLEPGTLKILPSGMDIRFNAPQQATNGIQLAEHEVRAIASGLGVPAHLISGDLRQANYSSLRADMVRFRQRCEALQWNLLIPVVCQPVWDRAVRLAALRGELPGFFDDPAPFLAAEWYPPKIPHVDPAKEAEAIGKMMKLGLMSRRQAVAELGFDIEALDREIASDREREKTLNLRFGDTND